MSDAAESFHGHAHFAAPPPGVTVRHDWTLPEVRALYELPLLELIHKAQTVHRAVFQENKVQLCSLLSIKTGGCPEDCGYCPQAARYKTGVKAEKLMAVDEVLEAASRARAAGATRFCMGAAWREVKDGPQFDSVLEMVKGVRRLGMEACATLGMLSESQARRLREAGLSAYNHNLDTSAEHYGDIISTRTYDDRLRTLERVRQAGISVCSGGIIGLGESLDDRCKLLLTLANQEVHPESVPINALVPVEGTPLADQKRVETVEMVRTIATARLLMPLSMVRLSAGEKLLTTGNPEYTQDMALLEKAGIRPLEPDASR
jgi:biotin synthase